MIISKLLYHFMVVGDPREDNVRHKLIDIIAITFCAVIAGADTWEHIALFGKSKKEWFQGFLELPHGIPSATTFGRVFARIDPHEFNTAFYEWMKSLCPNLSEDIINIDGKKVRHSFDSSDTTTAIHMVSMVHNSGTDAWTSESYGKKQ